MKAVKQGGDNPEYDENGDLIKYYAVRPNKTQLKKDIAGIAKLAEELSHLSMAQLVLIKLPEKIENAIVTAKKMSPKKPARKRQLKFITAQLRNIELDEVIENLSRIKVQ